MRRCLENATTVPVCGRDVGLYEFGMFGVYEISGVLLYDVFCVLLDDRKRCYWRLLLIFDRDFECAVVITAIC